MSELTMGGLQVAVSVAEILNLPIMKGARVVAGKQGLGSNIRWVHVSELLDIARLLKGDELLLTTGMGLSVSPDRQTQYVRELAERNVAAVAISTLVWNREIPQAMIQAAEAVGLPLIALTQEIPFVQITEEVHTLIVNRHYAQVQQAETVAHQLNRAALQKQDATEILRILYQVLKNPVVCFSFDDRDDPGVQGGRKANADPAENHEGELRACYPPGDWGHDLIADLADRDLLTEVAETTPGLIPDSATPVTVRLRLGQRTVNTWLQPIVVSGVRWGYLAVVQSAVQLNEVERLVIDRAAVTLAYEILRRRALREQRRGSLSQLAETILSGQTADVQLVYRRARSLGHDLEDRWLAAGIVQGAAGIGQADMERRVTTACKRLSLGHLFVWKTQKVYLLLYGPTDSGLQIQLRALARLVEGPPDRRTATGAAIDEAKGTVTGFGRILFGLEKLDQSRKQAEFTLALRRQNPTRDVGPFFDRTGVHRLFVAGMDPTELHRFVEDELGPLLHLDASERDDMLQSLRALLDSNLAPSTVSRLLGLSRQTIYLRRERLERLLNCELDNPERRLALSLALRAMDSESLAAHRVPVK